MEELVEAVKALIGRSRVGQQSIGLQLDFNTTPVKVDEFTEYTDVICLIIRPVSSPAIAVFPAILSPPENTGIFFRPEFADIASIFFSTRNRRHIFGPEIASISSDLKLRACFPTQNFRHIFRPKISGIFSDSKLPAYLPARICRNFFDPNLEHLNLHLFFFYQSNDQGL